ncbi:hypothetical protein M407DRAFT_23580 [Tulasnella calospora MUT 4182]|uniref:F-box domain-containing protein n=1 Tax=Tulasnella calospora MUT 4182 TaxID=1051891 RepID=A0A0C3L0G8_9AGAM|nr:hypothetical protein M407DRAFT_23580 [Tulasnella calospora MUT 4182]
MKPPRTETIVKALAILMAGVNEENGSQAVCEDTTTLDSRTLEKLSETEHALDLAKSCIVRHTDRLISDIRHRRNMDAPIHRLPPEIFTTILTHLSDAYLIEGKNWWMMEFMTVNRIWREAIINSPRLWRVIQLDYSPQFTSLFMKCSKTQLLSLSWDASLSSHLDSNNEEFKDVLELTIQNSSRLQLVDVVVCCKRGELALERLLSGPTPQLESLHIELSFKKGDWEVETGQFTLLGRKPLKEVVLRRASLFDWDSQRLSILRVLNLENITKAPSSNQILRILSASPSLELLRLAWIHSPTNTLQENMGSGEELIELPHLKDIHLHALSPSYYSSILSRIRPGLCDNVWVVDFESGTRSSLFCEDLWTGSDAMAALLHLSKTAIPASGNGYGLSIVVDQLEVKIKNAFKGEPDPAIKAECIVSFRHLKEQQRCIDLLGQFFSSLRFEIPPLGLTVKDGWSWYNKPPDFRSFGHSLTSLRVQGHRLCRIVQQQLGEQCRTADGTLTWICPKLSFIELFYNDVVEEDEEMDGMALLLAVQRRWSGEHGIPPALQPSGFHVWRCFSRFSSIATRAKLIKSIVPSFEIH